MCIERNQFDSLINEIKTLKAKKMKLENDLKKAERKAIEFMVTTNQSIIIGLNFKVTYKEQQRVTLDKKALEEILGDDLKPYEKVSTYFVLRII